MFVILVSKVGTRFISVRNHRDNGIRLRFNTKVFRNDMTAYDLSILTVTTVTLSFGPAEQSWMHDWGRSIRCFCPQSLHWQIYFVIMPFKQHMKPFKLCKIPKFSSNVLLSTLQLNQWGNQRTISNFPRVLKVVYFLLGNFRCLNFICRFETHCPTFIPTRLWIWNGVLRNVGI
jgi:hypothetical protein